jgi:diguanylate cyclase (GGDEF)-like protein
MTDNHNKKPECPAGEEQCLYLDELLQLRQHNESLAELVHTDTLTGLFNFRHFSLVMEQEMERTRRSGQPTALIMLDLDHFKQINDTYGHEAGNRVLRHVADLMIQLLRRVDVPCRYGGEEFALILPGTTLPRAVNAADRVRRMLEETPVDIGGESIAVTASMGVNVYMKHMAQTLSDFVEQTDSYLYQAKQQGRNRVAHPDFQSVWPDTQVGREEKSLLNGE